MHSCPPQDKLYDLLAERLSAAEREGLDRHLRTCSACEQRLADLVNANAPPLSPAGAEFETLSPEANSFLNRLKQSPRPTVPAAGTVSVDLGVALPDPFPGEFRVIRRLGEGAFGTVWLADDLALHPRQVALKTLRHSAGDRQAKLDALRNEAGIMARFHHPNIVQVHAWRQSGADHYLVLQFVTGGSLQGRLENDGPFPWQVAARYVADVGDGLLELHRRGIVHRDIKPANILWDPERDETLLTDFGISAHLSDGPSVGGTPLYMAREAFDGHIGPAQDVYSLAATLFHLVTGEAPFAAAGLAALVRLIVQGLPPDDARCQDMPSALEEVIRAGLSADPERRPALSQFVARLRGSLNQSLADSLPAASSSPVNLRLAVSRQVGPGIFQPLTATQPSPGITLRNMKKVPRPPEQVLLRTGDRVRIELLADRDGYATVFNVGPTGDLNLLFPDEPTVAQAPPTIRSGQWLQVNDVEIELPAGRERLFAVWTSQPLPLNCQQLQAVAELPAPYLATRNLVRVKEVVRQLRVEDCRVLVLELDHAQ